jgi:hypothetical protein
MLVLIFFFIAFFFLVVGALQFLGCVAVPRLRKYALSAALWWAAWGPCTIGLTTLAGLALVARALTEKDGDAVHIHPHLVTGIAWGYVVLGCVGTVAIATCLAWLHQAIVRRFTFALFRIYATVVTAGIGSVFGWCFAWWMLGEQVRYGWAVSLCVMLLLVIVFAVRAYEGARALRGSAPTQFAWVTPQEFEGT